MPIAPHPREVDRFAVAEDDDLLRRAVRGDQEAFAQIYRAHQATLYRFALRMSGSTWTAEEIVQEVFLTLLRQPGAFDPARGELGAFLFGIARNHLRKQFSRRPHEIPLDAGGELPPGARLDAAGNGSAAMNPAAWAEQRQQADRVRRAVLDLPEEFREAVVLCDLEELSYEEAARLLDCPLGTVRSRLHRGRALLLARLELLREQPRKAVIR
ncbi:MAG: sigma-70 family RNA polymerase sigma factor [Acidobacteriia bacterium]|nr:sigma-70 family RNA polymerase sigma factor [Terriglobia bacterium]